MRARTSTRRPARSRWWAWTPWSPSPTRSSASWRGSRSCPTREAQAACDAIDRACRKLRIFLDELVNGAPPVPLKLFPEYEAMQRARGVKAAAPTDLFYPDLSPRAPKLAPRRSIAPQRLPSYMVKQRRLYQRGLLAWLRGDDERREDDARRRRRHRGRDRRSGSLRAFWWTVGALLERIVEKGLDPGFGVKQLAARIDLQIRRVVEGSARSPTGCVAKCSISSRSARRWRRRCRRCSARSSCPGSFPSRRSAVGRRRAPAAAAARSARAAGGAPRTRGSSRRRDAPRTCRS